MTFEIGINLRVTECLDKGDRDYMEDFSRCYFERVEGSIVFGFFGIFDGHGGSEAASFARQTLIIEIKKLALFWSDDDDDVLKAIKQGFINTHQLMWAEREKWSKTVSGFDSTAGTTATIAIVRNRKLYIGHVGDSACVLGHSKMLSTRTDQWEPSNLTVEHKPSNLIERQRIESCGGSLAKKSGVERVVWKRPKQNDINQNSNECDSIKFDEVPFLAVTRSLGDLWSYNERDDVYHISPEPDIKCIPLDSIEHRCLILGSDGLWNVVSTGAAIEIVRICERETERRVFLDPSVNCNFFYNPAASLVKYALSQWKHRHLRSDNVSVLVIMIDPPGPSMTTRREERRRANFRSLDIQTSPNGKQASYDSFSRSLATEYLIECRRWRSANDNKDECAALRSNTPSADTFTVRPVAKLVNGTQSEIASHRAIMSHSFYSTYCQAWAHQTKMWIYLQHYFTAKNLSTESDVIAFLNGIDPRISSETLPIIPWIYKAKKRFKDDTQLYVSLNLIPLFSEFWLHLHSKVIRPFEKSASSHSAMNMHAVLAILKPNIVGVLKQYDYFLTKPVAEEALKQHRLDSNNRNNSQTLGPQKCMGTIVERWIRKKGGWKTFRGNKESLVGQSQSFTTPKIGNSDKKSNGKKKKARQNIVIRGHEQSLPINADH